MSRSGRAWDPVPFALLWVGQTLSTLGTLMTNFGLVLWVWSRTGQAMPVAMVEFCTFGAVVALGPFAGVVCDRWGRIRTLVACNTSAVVVLAVLLLVAAADALSPPWVYAALVALGGVLAFQYPALAASVTSLVPSEHYARAGGLLSLATSVTGVAAPALAALVLAHGGLVWVFAIDLVSYLLCALALAAVGRRARMPAPPETPTRRRLFADLGHGFRYITARRELLALQTLFFLFYFAAMFGVLLPPMVLARSTPEQGAVVLATVLGAAGVGGIVGGLVTAAWGPRRRLVPVILVGFVLTGLGAQLPLGISASPFVWAAASFLGAFLYPLVEAANQAIWQTRTPVAEQGRIFAARRVMTESAGVTVLLLAGPLADDVFESAMRGDMWLGSALGGLVGTGSGSGTAVLLGLSGVLTLLIGGWGFTSRHLRDLDRVPPQPPDREPSAESTLTT